jgi:hypothetical protein
VLEDDPALGRPPVPLAGAPGPSGKGDGAPLLPPGFPSLNADVVAAPDEDEDVRRERERALSRQGAATGLCVRNLSATYAQREREREREREGGRQRQWVSHASLCVCACVRE